MANIELLKRAIKVIEAVPSGQFGLDSIVTIGGDTLLGDAAYWLAQDPQFQALGLSVQRGGGIYVDNVYRGYSSAMAEIFDMPFNDAFLMFGRRNDTAPISDKAVFLGRVRGYIFDAEQKAKVKVK